VSLKAASPPPLATSAFSAGQSPVLMFFRIFDFFAFDERRVILLQLGLTLEINEEEKCRF